jgi:hypothetical protein
MPAIPATPNGEHAAEKAAKAAAKAAAEKAAAEKREGEKVLGPLTRAAQTAAAGYSDAAAKADERQHALGRALLAVEKVLASYPVLGSIASFCEANVPEVSGPVFGSSPAYRALCAARVIELDPTSATLSVDAVRAAHRVKDVKGAVPKVLRAAKAKAKKDGTRVTASIVGEVLQDLYPKDEATTPGPKAKPKAAKPKASRNEPTKDAVSEVPDLAISATRLKGAATRVAKVLESDDKFFVAAGIVKACEDYGIAATREAVVAAMPKPKATRRAAKPKAS